MKKFGVPLILSSLSVFYNLYVIQFNDNSYHLSLSCFFYLIAILSWMIELHLRGGK